VTARGAKVDYVRLSALRKLERIGRVILVGSGKGGVGKSLVACGLALRLSEAGYRTGILDTDLHGASVPNYFGVKPPVSSGAGGVVPKESGRVKVMSVALFTGDGPVPVRGGGKEGLITELFALTDWGDLDFLVVDLPPSTGDELLTAFGLFAPKSTLLLVTTPSPGSLSVVSKLRALALSEGIPVEGVVVNMAYAEAGGKRIYPFGRAETGRIVSRFGAPLLALVPLEPAVSGPGLRSALDAKGAFSDAFNEIVKRVLKG
jgi:ATP-binding protein involved in chromosome partitioning